MIEYIAKFYNDKDYKCMFSENIKTFDISQLYNEKFKDISLIIIEKQITNPDVIKTFPSIIIADKQKWKIVRNNSTESPVKKLISDNIEIIVRGKCRTKYFSSKEEMQTIIKKIQSNYYFIDKDEPKYPDYETYYNNKHHL